MVGLKKINARIGGFNLKKMNPPQTQIKTKCILKCVLLKEKTEVGLWGRGAVTNLNLCLSTWSIVFLFSHFNVT